MIADHFTKLLQGALFRKFRAEMMNITKGADMIEMGMNDTVLAERVT